MSVHVVDYGEDYPLRGVLHFVAATNAAIGPSIVSRELRPIDHRLSLCWSSGTGSWHIYSGFCSMIGTIDPCTTAPSLSDFVVGLRYDNNQDSLLSELLVAHGGCFVAL